MSDSTGMLSVADMDFLSDLLARVGQEEIMARFQRAEVETKADGSLLTEADLNSQRRIAEALAGRWPDIPLLGEEMSAEEQQRRLEAGGLCWCLDPLDGTTNFAAGFPLFCISLALLRDGRAVAGVVHDPSRQETFTAREGQGAHLNGAPLLTGDAPLHLESAVGMIDFPRLSSGLACRLAQRPPFRSLRCLGAAALEWCWLAAGRGHLYLHGGQKLWDYAAGRLVFREAGGSEPAAGSEEVPSLAPRLALAAVNADLLREWQHWLAEDASISA